MRGGVLGPKSQSRVLQVECQQRQRLAGWLGGARVQVLFDIGVGGLQIGYGLGGVFLHAWVDYRWKGEELLIIM